MVTPEEAGVPAAADALRDTAPSASFDEQELAARQIIYESVAPLLVDLATEIRRSLDFYRRQHQNEEIDRIFISGGSALIPGLDVFLASETGVAIELANPFEYLVTDEEVQPSAYLRDIAPDMVVAVGLALRDMVE